MQTELLYETMVYTYIIYQKTSKIRSSSTVDGGAVLHSTGRRVVRQLWFQFRMAAESWEEAV